MATLAEINSRLEQLDPTLFSTLSPLGRAVFYPPDIPAQAAEARGKRYNATIGQITDGAGAILALPSIAAGLDGLAAQDRNRALLYSPMAGLPEMRERWDAWQRPAAEPPTRLPIVLAGLTHALSILADLFGGPGRRVFVPAPFWGNYRHLFGTRTGATIESVAAYDEELRFVPSSIAAAINKLPAGEPAMVVLNIPSNPVGYSPTADERDELRASLSEAARRRPIVVICDDAYSGLVFDDAIPKESLFWMLREAHPQLYPFRVAGATKELVLFGGRVGCLTLPFAISDERGALVENKALGLLRAGLGSPVATSQVLALLALREPNVQNEVNAVVSVLKSRWETLTRALTEAAETCSLIRRFPCNSGAFSLIELDSDLDPEAVRRHLLEHEDTGVVAIKPRYIRLAFCSVAEEDLGELVRRVVRGIEAVAAAGPGG